MILVIQIYYTKYHLIYIQSLPFSLFFRFNQYSQVPSLNNSWFKARELWDTTMASFTPLKFSITVNHLGLIPAPKRLGCYTGPFYLSPRPSHIYLGPGSFIIATARKLPFPYLDGPNNATGLEPWRFSLFSPPFQIIGRLTFLTPNFTTRFIQKKLCKHN